MPTFKPSEMDINASFPPLTATMGRTEREIAATLLVRVCQVKDDKWQPVDLGSLNVILMKDLEEKREPIHSLSTNPFCKPDFYDLVEKGFCQLVGNESDGWRRALEFTEQGLNALKVWAKWPMVVCPHSGRPSGCWHLRKEPRKPVAGLEETLCGVWSRYDHVASNEDSICCEACEALHKSKA